MKIERNDYNEAEKCLRRYDFNSATILFKREDILGLSAVNYNGMPKAPYNISDSVYRTVTSLEQDLEYQKALKEYKAVELAKKIVSKDCIVIFEEYYRKRQGKYKIMYENAYSEATYKRRKQELIYAVSEALKKMSQN